MAPSSENQVSLPQPNSDYLLSIDDLSVLFVLVAGLLILSPDLWVGAVRCGYILRPDFFLVFSDFLEA